MAAQLPRRRAVLETAKIAEALSRTRQARALAYGERGSAAWSKSGLSPAAQALAQRLRWPLARESIHLLDEGANPGQVDRCLVAFGFTEGLFAEADRRGFTAVFGDCLDPEASPQSWLTYSPTLDLMADAGRHGGGAPGWYRYSEGDGGHASFDAEVDRLLDSSAMFQRMTRQPIPDERVIERCLMAMINASAAELQRGKGLRAEAVDALWSASLGFPAWQGGPLYQAHDIGLPEVVARISAIHAHRNTLGAPEDILVRTAARRGTLG
jgi:3-hydroxyacyl-CoA dehydrogenase